MKSWKQALTMMALALGTMFGMGCASTEPENVSERPWNAPKHWEHGLPTGLGSPRY